MSRVIPGHEDAARRGAQRAAGVSVGEAHAFPSQLVDIRSTDLVLSVAANVPVSQVVGQDEDNTGTRSCGGSRPGRKEQTRCGNRSQSPGGGPQELTPADGVHDVRPPRGFALETRSPGCVRRRHDNRRRANLSFRNPIQGSHRIRSAPIPGKTPANRSCLSRSVNVRC